jgi:hypothetical protein
LVRTIWAVDMTVIRQKIHTKVGRKKSMKLGRSMC